MAGRIDVHSHLLPGLDDGCATLKESLACARVLVSEGYSHSFCTPHIWPSLPNNTADRIRQRTAELQAALGEADIPLHLLPGGEINLRPDTADTHPDNLVTYALGRKFVLIDLWADRLPEFFERSVRWLQSQGVTVVLAHPERMKAVQNEPELADLFAEMGMLLQGNLQCLGDPPNAPTRRLAERYLREDRYFMLGTDLHNLASLPVRISGLRRAVEVVGPEGVDRLTVQNPSTLLP